jgi:hypothetical protein
MNLLNTQMNVILPMQHFSIQVKSLKPNTCPPSHLDGCTIAKAVKRARISNAREFLLTHDVEEPWSIDPL